MPPFRIGRLVEQNVRRLRKSISKRLRACRRRRKHQRRIKRILKRQSLNHILDRCTLRPSVSLVLPVSSDQTAHAQQTMASALQQIYPDCELHIVRWGEGREITAIEAQTANSPVSVQFHRTEASNAAQAVRYGLAQCRGKLVAILSPGDWLLPDAVAWLVRAFNARPDGKWFYFDEVQTDRGKPVTYRLQPAYSPEWLLSQVAPPFGFFRRDHLMETGKLDGTTLPAFVQELALRVSERIDPSEAVHIAKVGRKTGKRFRPKDRPAAKRIVQAALARRGLVANVQDQSAEDVFQLKFRLPADPKVTIFIPTRNSVELVRSCVESLQAATNYKNYEIVVIDNQSDDPALDTYLQQASRRLPLRVMRYDQPFNHSDMHNLAVTTTDAEFVVLVNNDVAEFSSGWLEQFVATAQTDDSIAAVGALLHYPDRTVQHAGVIVGWGGLVASRQKQFQADTPGYLGRLQCVQEFSAVTAALMLVRRSAWNQIGGFDGARYPTSYNDIDFCLRARERGFRILYHPLVRALHHETKTRPIIHEHVYQQRFREDWPEALAGDVFYHPLLTLHHKMFEPDLPRRWEEAQIASLIESTAAPHGFARSPCPPRRRREQLDAA